MSAREYLVDQVWESLGNPREDEERGPYAMPLEQLQHPPGVLYDAIGDFVMRAHHGYGPVLQVDREDMGNALGDLLTRSRSARLASRFDAKLGWPWQTGQLIMCISRSCA